MQQRTHTPPQPPSLTTREPLQGHGARVGDALHALCSPTTEPWPDGVIARYLTVAGATVELIDGPDHVTGTCSGCPQQRWPGPFHYDPCCTGARMEAWVIRDATNWAQRHAETCRALPRPAVNQ